MLIKLEKESKDLIPMRQEYEELILNLHNGFVFKTAHKYSDSNNFDDVIQMARIGLIDAMKKFDADKDVKFLSYAVWHVNKRVFGFIKSDKNPVKIPSNLRDVYSSYRRLKYSDGFDLDKWLRERLVNNKTWNIPRTKQKLLMLDEAFKVVDTKVEFAEFDMEIEHFIQESFEDSLIEELSAPKGLLQDIERVVGNKYLHILQMQMEGLTLRNIASKLGCSVQAVHIKVTKIRSKLRECEWFVEKWGGDRVEKI